MVQSGMRITVDAAMRARDVSKPSEDLPENLKVAETCSPEPASGGTPAKPRKGERRRLSKRTSAQRTLTDQEGKGGSFPVSS